MKRSMVVPIALGGLVAVGIAPAAASAAKPKERTIVIKARSQLDRVQLIDNQPTGPGPGDVLVFTERLLDADGRQIGTDAATCTRLFDETSLCTGVYSLRGGRLMVQLLQPGPTGVYDQAITGGTGRFAGARGIVTVDQRGDGDRFTFRIRVPR